MFSRFDTDLMTPPEAGAAPDAARLARLRAWCEAETSAHAIASFAVAWVPEPTDLDAAACELDGSRALARMSRLRGLAWRLLILLRSLVPARRWSGAEVWDCGWWRPGARAAAAAFRPRRPTLLLVGPGDPSDAASLLATLKARSAGNRWPLRVIVVSQRPPDGAVRL